MLDDSNECLFSTVDYDPLITQFGYWGNGLDRYTVSSWSSRANILCGTYNHTHVQLDWYFPNGSRVGVVDRGFRAGHLPNGTAVLQIEGQVNFCWGGNYTCIADSDTESDVRVFTLLVNCKLYIYIIAIQKMYGVRLDFILSCCTSRNI